MKGNILKSLLIITVLFSIFGCGNNNQKNSGELPVQSNESKKETNQLDDETYKSIHTILLQTDPAYDKKVENNSQNNIYATIIYKIIKENDKPDSWPEVECYIFIYDKKNGNTFWNFGTMHYPRNELSTISNISELFNGNIDYIDANLDMETNDEMKIGGFYVGAYEYLKIVKDSIQVELTHYEQDEGVKYSTADSVIFSKIINLENTDKFYIGTIYKIKKT